jgi:hypothetical protein
MRASPVDAEDVKKKKTSLDVIFKRIINIIAKGAVITAPVAVMN